MARDKLSSNSLPNILLLILRYVPFPYFQTFLAANLAPVYAVDPTTTFKAASSIP